MGVSLELRQQPCGVRELIMALAVWSVCEVAGGGLSAFLVKLC